MEYEFEIITYDKNITETREKVKLPSLQALDLYCRQKFGREYDVILLRAFDIFDNVIFEYSRKEM